MSYIDAYKDQQNVIHVIERENGKRVFRDYKSNFVFYYEDKNGLYTSLWNTSCSKYSTTNSKEFRAQIAIQNANGNKIYEKDVNPLFRCLEENYSKNSTPQLNIAFFDIETDFDPDRGFADVWNPFARITAVTVYQKWTGKLITLVLKPDLPEDHEFFLTYSEAEKITNKFENCYLCDSEELLFEIFFELIQDADVLSGWNSLGYDIPYMVNRAERILGKAATKKFNAFPGTYPKIKKYIKFKKEHRSYDLMGRIHLDYLDLYQKHSASEMSSYRLDYIGYVEVGENKVQYDGTLDTLYKKDFEKFIAYNRQDVALLDKIDNKKKYIELANQIAHTNCVLLQTTMGSVALIDQAIINETHRIGKVAPSKKSFYDKLDFDDEDGVDNLDVEFDINKGPAVGAHVADPKVGLHSEIGCCDINSLYPSTIRSLNMGPETLIGQIRNEKTNDFIKSRIDKGLSVPEAWHNVFCLLEFDMIHNKTDDILTIDFIDGSMIQLTAKEIYNMIYEQNSNFVLSANCTLFDKTRKGVIPGLLERWYSERKDMQSKEKIFTDLLNDGIECPTDILDLLNG